MEPITLVAPRPGSARLARITVDQYHRMVETGILREGAPIELLDGLLVYRDRSAVGEDPMTTGEPHAVAVGLLLDLDRLLGAHGCHLRSQLPLCLPPHHEPEPDGAVVRGARRDYLRRHPGPEAVSCVIEVSDSSLEHDRTTKLEIYARAGIPQYVIVSIPGARLLVFEEPVAAEARYARAAQVGPESTVSLNVGTGARLELPARDLLP